MAVIVMRTMKGPEMQDNIDAILSILTAKLISIEDEYKIKYPEADEVIADIISDILIEFDNIKPSEVNEAVKFSYTDKLEKFINDNWDDETHGLKVKS